MIIQILQLSDNVLTCARFAKRGKELPVPVSGFRDTWHNHTELLQLINDQLPPVPGDIRTILSLPATDISLREITLPISDRNKLRALLPLELAGDLANDEAELVCDALPLADANLLAGWAPVPLVSEQLQLLAQRELDPEVVTCAWLNWHLLIPQEQQDTPVALVDDSALMICLNGKPLFCRAMATDGDNVARTLAAVELAKGVTVTTIYRIEGAVLPGELKLPLPAQLSGTPAHGDLGSDALVSPFATALAYCSGTVFNLRNGPLAWTGKRSHLLRQFRLPMVLGLLVLLLLTAEGGLRWYLLARDMASVNSSIATIYREIFPTRKKAVDETSEVKAEIRRLQGAGAGSDLLPFLNQLAQIKGDQIQGFSEVEYDAERFRLKGDARSNAAATVLSRKLSASGWIVDQPELTARPDGTTLFLIKGRRGGTKP